MRSTVLCLAALAQLALSAFADPQPYRVPLYRRTTSSSSSSNSSNGIVKAATTQLDGGILAGTVSIGCPPQEFTMAFDTTTGYTWVRGSRCKTENCLDRCTYYARRSETAVSTGKKFSVEYGDACVDTYIYYDDIEFAGLKVHNMPFGSAYRMSGFDSGFDGYFGLGRAVDLNQTKVYSTLTRRDTTSSSAFVPNAYQQGSGIQSSQFGFYTVGSSSSSGFSQSGATTDTSTTTTSAATVATTTSAVPAASTLGVPASNSTTSAVPSAATSATTTTTSSSTGDVTSGGFGFTKRHSTPEPDGYLILGGVDKSLIKGEMEYIPLADTPDGSAKNWDLCIRDANFDNLLNIRQKPNAIASISTATPYITMPADQADLFEKEFGLKYYHSTQTYGIKCSKAAKLPTLKLTLEDHIVELPPQYWVHEIDRERDCCGTLIRRGSSTRDWTLGTAFTNAFYTSFDPDNETIGLGIKKDQKDDGLKVYKKSH